MSIFDEQYRVVAIEDDRLVIRGIALTDPSQTPLN